jgi:hypothetical protein
VASASAAATTTATTRRRHCPSPIVHFDPSQPNRSVFMFSYSPFYGVASLAMVGLELVSQGRLYYEKGDFIRLKVGRFAAGGVRSSEWKELRFVYESEVESKAMVLLGQLLQEQLNPDQHKRPTAKEVEERLEAVSGALTVTEVLLRCFHTAGLTHTGFCSCTSISRRFLLSWTPPMTGWLRLHPVPSPRYVQHTFPTTPHQLLTTVADGTDCCQHNTRITELTGVVEQIAERAEALEAQKADDNQKVRQDLLCANTHLQIDVVLAWQIEQLEMDKAQLKATDEELKAKVKELEMMVWRIAV